MNDMNKQNKPECSPREEVECKSLLAEGNHIYEEKTDFDEGCDGRPGQQWSWEECRDCGHIKEES